MKKLFIFDLDGTLVNSLYDLADSMNEVLRSHGLPTHGTEKYKYFVGNGTLKLVERALPEELRNDERIAALHAEFAEVYGKNALNKTRPYDGIPELLERLKAEGRLIAVASNKPHVFSKLITETLFGEGYFDAVFGKRDGVPTKPSPEIMQDILTKTGVSADDAVHSGDSDVDIITAKNAGIESIGCTWGFRTREELLAAGADHIADTPADIFRLIK